MNRIFVGAHPETGKNLCQPLERHALTIAGAGAGKGAAQIIPNLKGDFAWRGSTVVVDPAGEAAEECAAWRAETLGQKVVVLDPFDFCDVSKVKPYLCGLNLLEMVKTSDDLHMLADGIVKRVPGEREPHWINSATQTIAGMLHYLVTSSDLKPEERHIGMLWPVLTLLQSRDLELVKAMQTCPGFEYLAAATSRRFLKDTSESKSILSTVETQLKWLSSTKMAAWMQKPSGVNLNDLKGNGLTIFLVIPPDMLGPQGQFLRLISRAAISAMQQRMPNGNRKGTPCLMILDEFYSLGRMSEMQEAAAQMRKFGLHLWPFLQDWGQLTELYGKEGAQSFVANTDLVCVYGVGDPFTAQEVSSWCGRITDQDVETEWLAASKEFEESEKVREATGETWGIFDEYYFKKIELTGGFLKPGDIPLVRNEILSTKRDMIRSRLGNPRIPPDVLQKMTAKAGAHMPSARMLVFTPSVKALVVALSPYFAPYQPSKTANDRESEILRKYGFRFAPWSRLTSRSHPFSIMVAGLACFCWFCLVFVFIVEGFSFRDFPLSALLFVGGILCVFLPIILGLCQIDQGSDLQAVLIGVCMGAWLITWFSFLVSENVNVYFLAKVFLYTFGISSAVVLPILWMYRRFS